MASENFIDGNETKRQRTDGGGILKLEQLEGDNLVNLTSKYQKQQPYPHCVIRDICDDGFLRQARQELIEGLTATLKETDLYKVLQTPDLANIDEKLPEVAAKVPNLLKLRQALYSEEFRKKIAALVGCEELSGRVDCASNVHTKGCHLLCHDDVISNRRVSYILYLTDPDEEWQDHDGGALELYPLVDSQLGVPDTVPTKAILPLWNSLAVFTVIPGRSFHSVQEVVAEAKPRLSIQGWFHSSRDISQEEGRSAASLQQLQGKGAGHKRSPYLNIDNIWRPAAASEPIQSSNPALNGSQSSQPALSPDDIATLEAYLNPTYLTNKAIKEIQTKFNENASVQLHNFLTSDLAQSIQHSLTSHDKADGLGHGRSVDYTVGISSSWRATGPPHMQRYLSLLPPPLQTSAACGAANTAASSTQNLGIQTREQVAGQTSSATVQTSGSTRDQDTNCSTNKGGPPDSNTGGPPDTGRPLDAQAPGQASQLGGTGSCSTKLQSKPSQSPNQSCNQSPGAPGDSLAGVAAALLQSQAFQKYLQAITDIDIVSILAEVRRFRPGLDYTIAHHGQLCKEPVLDMTLCFVDDREEEDAALWAIEDVGGFQCYMLQDGGASEEVFQDKQDDGDYLISCPAKSNTLNIVLRDDVLMKFVKYVNRDAPGSRWDIACECKVDMVLQEDS